MDAFQTQEYYGLLVLCGVLPFVFWYYAPLPLLTAWSYFLICTARVADTNRLTQGKRTLHVGHSSATALLLLIVIPVVVWLTPRRFRQYFTVALICALFLNLIPLAMTSGVVNVPARGLFDCESFDAGIMAAILPVAVVPFALQATAWRGHVLVALSFLVPLAATIVTRTTTGFYILAAIGVGMAGYKRGFARKFILSCTGATVALGLAFAANGLTHTSGRWAGWKFFMKWWGDYGSPWTYLVGMGGGTFQYLGTLIQISQKGLDAFTGGGWLWLHNDWLQILFEYGVLGLLIAGCVFAWAVATSRHRPWVAIGLAAMAFLSTAQFPMHWILTQVWVTILLREAFARLPADTPPGV